MTSRPPSDIDRSLLTPSDNLIQQVFRFCIVGVVAVAVDVLLLSLFVERYRMHYLPAAPFSFMCGVIVNYILSSLWVFRPGKHSRGKEIMLFWGGSIVALGINNLVIWLMFSLASNYLLAKFSALVFVSIWNFVGRKKLAFSG